MELNGMGCFEGGLVRLIRIFIFAEESQAYP